MDFSVDGLVTDIKEKKANETDLIKMRELSFNFFDAKQRCNAKVTFATDDEEVNLWKNAVSFVKRLTHYRK
jgi:hypothetical protein